VAPGNIFIITTMKTLEQYSKNGYGFTLIKRIGNFALFIGTSPISRNVNYEVIEIQSHDGMNIAGKDIAPAEYAPGNNAWGAKGWTLLTLEDAEAKLEELVNSYSVPK